MQMTHKLLFISGLTILFFGCKNGSNNNSSVQEDIVSSPASSYVSSSAAKENNNDTLHKFIRTADLKFKVKSVIKSTYSIEETTARQDGFVTCSKLESNIDHKDLTPVSADSSLETMYFTVSNDIIIRVPNTKLDTTLKIISRQIDFLDYRIIKADDVALKIYANKLTENRIAKNKERVTNEIDKQGKKLNETTNAENSVLDKQEQADNAKVSNLDIADQVKFSTISITIYQRGDIKREMVSNNKNIDAYTPGLGSQILASIKTGWEIMEAFLIFIAKLWAFILLGIAAYILYRKYSRQAKK